MSVPSRSEPMNFIGGEWTRPSGAATLDVHEPATGQVIGRIVESSQEDVDRAVAAAREAFDHGTWGKTSALERSRLLIRLGTLIQREAGRLAEIEARDTGKPASVAKADIVALARYFEFYGGAADKLHGETVPYLNGYFVTVTPEPHGVTGISCPGTIRRRCSAGRWPPRSRSATPRCSSPPRMPAPRRSPWSISWWRRVSRPVP